MQPGCVKQGAGGQVLGSTATVCVSEDTEAMAFGCLILPTHAIKCVTLMQRQRLLVSVPGRRRPLGRPLQDVTVPLRVDAQAQAEQHETSVTLAQAKQEESSGNQMQVTLCIRL